MGPQIAKHLLYNTVSDRYLNSWYINIGTHNSRGLECYTFMVRFIQRSKGTLWRENREFCTSIESTIFNTIFLYFTNFNSLLFLCIMMDSTLLALEFLCTLGLDGGNFVKVAMSMFMTLPTFHIVPPLYILYYFISC